MVTFTIAKCCLQLVHGYTATTICIQSNKQQQDILVTQIHAGTLHNDGGEKTTTYINLMGYCYMQDSLDISTVGYYIWSTDYNDRMAFAWYLWPFNS